MTDFVNKIKPSTYFKSIILFRLKQIFDPSMQEIQFQNNAFPSEYLKLKESNKCALNDIFQKNFLHGIQNARNILSSLEHSIEKSNFYEDKLLRCRASHKHSHDFNDWPWETDFSDDKDFKTSGTKSDSRKTEQENPPVNLLESWSTVSIVCLQYQYEELSKHYEALLKAFSDKCNVIDTKKLTIARLRQRARVMHAHLASAHKSLLCVGEKYLALKKRRHEQLQQCDKKIEYLKSRVKDVLATAESARLHVDLKLSQCMFLEQDSEYAMLLAEMKKCNQLYMENLKLKAQLEEYLPGSVDFNK